MPGGRAESSAPCHTPSLELLHFPGTWTKSVPHGSKTGLKLGLVQVVLVFQRLAKAKDVLIMLIHVNTFLKLHFINLDLQ